MTSWHNWTNYVRTDIDKITKERMNTEHKPESVYGKLKQENEKLINENSNLTNELEFYKSLFNEKRNSCIFNLKIKKMNGENVWIDKVLDQREDFLKLDKDEEVEEWLKPVRCER